MHNEPGYHPMGWKAFSTVSETPPVLLSDRSGHNQSKLRPNILSRPSFAPTFRLRNCLTSTTVALHMILT
jgi:hypothetical protein